MILNHLLKVMVLNNSAQFFHDSFTRIADKKTSNTVSSLAKNPNKKKMEKIAEKLAKADGKTYKSYSDLVAAFADDTNLPGLKAATTALNGTPASSTTEYKNFTKTDLIEKALAGEL
jgi:hypothetical protein